MPDLTTGDQEPKTYFCVADYGGGDADRATIIRSSVPHSYEDWDEVIERASLLHDPIQCGEGEDRIFSDGRRVGDDPALAAAVIRGMLEAEADAGGGALDLLPILWPDRGYRVEQACRIAWE